LFESPSWGFFLIKIRNKGKIFSYFRSS